MQALARVKTLFACPLERRGELTARLFAPVSSTAGLCLAVDAK
jgi:hypothetical protein